MSPPLLEVENLVKSYGLPREFILRGPGRIEALRGVSFTVTSGRSFGIVGESGSGKSTLARAVMALERPDAGAVRFLGRDVNGLAPKDLVALRRNFQMVFQDPYGSLDPRQSVRRIVAEPLSALPEIAKSEYAARVGKALASVGLRAGDGDKFPHEFSGGQRQRIAIARALITKPKLIVADEPVSALDVSVQAQVLNLLADLQRDFGVTFLLISHDLAVVDHVCDEVAVLYAGRIVEQGAPEALFARAAHPYTRALIAAVPRAAAGARRRGRDARPRPLEGAQGTACAYAPRCPLASAVCAREVPVLREVGAGQRVACHHAEAVM